jgi:hypothetical protein
LAVKPQRFQTYIPPEAPIKKNGGELARTGFDLLGGHRPLSLSRMIAYRSDCCGAV